MAKDLVASLNDELLHGRGNDKLMLFGLVELTGGNKSQQKALRWLRSQLKGTESAQDQGGGVEGRHWKRTSSLLPPLKKNMDSRVSTT